MGFLDEIIPAVGAYLARPDYLAGLPARPRHPPPRFASSLRLPTGGLSCVAEFKRVSPGYSGAPLPATDPVMFAAMVDRGGADGISCLACRPRFQGSPQDVARITERTRLPVLFKDFVIDPRQLEAAYRSGASAVLLIARLETERRLKIPLKELLGRAHHFGLETFLELHLTEDLELARSLSADAYGVNVRDLDSLQMERTQATQLLKEAQSLRPLLGLSGVRAPEDVDWFRQLGTDGFLVGTALARASEPEAFLAELVERGRLQRP